MSHTRNRMSRRKCVIAKELCALRCAKLCESSGSVHAVSGTSSHFMGVFEPVLLISPYSTRKTAQKIPHMGTMIDAGSHYSMIFGKRRTRPTSGVQWFCRVFVSMRSMHGQYACPDHAEGMKTLCLFENRTQARSHRSYTNNEIITKNLPMTGSSHACACGLPFVMSVSAMAGHLSLSLSFSSSSLLLCF